MPDAEQNGRLSAAAIILTQGGIIEMYNVEEIKELLKAFDESKATRLEIVTENGELLKISQRTRAAKVVCSDIQTERVVPEAVPAEEKTQKPAPQTGSTASHADGKAVASPMVGVFYAAPSPDSDPYVSVGTRVKKGDVLCLIEAMKLMNEVTAEQSGEIAEVCVENGQVVEFGQPLFIIKG